MARAFEQYWSHWPEVVTVTPFQLSDPNGWWEKFDWVRPTSLTTANGLPTQPRLQYARLIPGTGLVRGTVRDAAGEGLKGAVIATTSGGFLAKTAADGSFILLASPGTYDLEVSRPGFLPQRVSAVAIASGAVVPLDLALAESLPTALENPSFETGDLSGWTSWGVADGVQQGPWYADIAPRHRSYFLGAAGNCEEKDGGVYQIIAARPGATVRASAWLLTYREGPAPIGSRVGLDPSGGRDPQSPGVVWSPLVETDNKWRRVTVSATARAAKVTVFLEYDQDKANQWNVSAFDGVEVAASE
jgi:hypothetical protein